MKFFIVLFCILVIPFLGLAQSEVYKKSGVAINGYDPVAYFKESKPVVGSKEFTYSWNSANWQFANAQNLADFKANPGKYAPQFGGYCAYGVADGHKASTEPDAWTIVDGKLYLNYDKDVRDLWNKKQKEYIETANKNWPEVKKEKD
jgi:hypothetical protein